MEISIKDRRTSNNAVKFKRLLKTVNKNKEGDEAKDMQLLRPEELCV